MELQKLKTMMPQYLAFLLGISKSQKDTEEGEALGTVSARACTEECYEVVESKARCRLQRMPPNY